MADFRRTTLAAALTLTVLGVVPACSSDPDPADTFKSFTEALSKNDISGLTMLDSAGKSLTGATAQTALTTLEGDLSTYKPAVAVKTKPKASKDEAAGQATVTWPLATGVTWTYDVTVQLKKQSKQWVAVFAPTAVHPGLHEGDKLTLKRTAADRGNILDQGGQPITSNRPVVTIGLEPRAVTDIPSVTKTLADAIATVEPGVKLDDLATKVKAAKPDGFYEVITLRREKYDQIKGRVQPLPGTRFKEGTKVLGPNSTFARALLGTVSDVTKEVMDKNPGKYRLGDQVGQGGLQQRYDERLRGAPALTVVIPAVKGGAAEQQLFTSQASAGAAIKTTIDPAVQNAAETALAAETRPWSLVAVRVSDSSTVAVANGPGAAGVNTALTGSLPPGSTFKTVTTISLLDSGSVAPDTNVPCPATFQVEGRSFKNAEDEVLGDSPFHTDFAKSCNTAFVSLAPKLGADGLAKTAATLGIGAQWDMGTDAFSGSVATGGSATDQAAAAFGQGKTLVSPVALAGVAAAVARGQWKQPLLVLDPAPAKPAADGPALKGSTLDALRPMMREVVTAGTAASLKNVNGLYGKTGTAEHDDNAPDKTHSWFMGYRGDLAFVVFVQDGGLSTQAAVPLAGKFLAALPA